MNLLISFTFALASVSYADSLVQNPERDSKTSLVLIQKYHLNNPLVRREFLEDALKYLEKSLFTVEKVMKQNGFPSTEEMQTLKEVLSLYQLIEEEKKARQD